MFFPQEALDTWLLDDKVELVKDELSLRSEGRKFRITEASRVLKEITGTPDPFDLVGKVKSHGFLRELGAEIIDRSMLIGDNAYDIVPGFLGTPIGSMAEHRASLPDIQTAPKNEEELLGRFLMKVL